MSAQREQVTFMARLPIKSYARSKDPLELPKLIDVQLDSFDLFVKEGLA